MCSGPPDGAAGTDPPAQQFRGPFQGNRWLQRWGKISIRKQKSNHQSFNADVPLKPAHSFMDASEEGRSKIWKLGIGFTSLVLLGGFSETLHIIRSNIKELEYDVDDLRLASPRFDKG
jgi:hypothetical protein